MSTDIHNYKRILERISEKIEESTSIRKSVKNDIAGFKDTCFSDGLSEGRIARYLFDVRKLLEWYGKDFRKASYSDIRALVAKIEQSKYAPATKRDLKITLRKYVRFLKGTRNFPRIVSWIKPSSRVKKVKIPEELLSQEDITNLIQAADSVRDRAFISTLYESGGRIGEVLTLKLKHVKPVETGMILRLDGKTGTRRVRVITSAPYLTELMNIHPYPKSGNISLWITRTGKELTYSACTQMIDRLGKKAGINKTLYPHLFRHSRATHLANHLTEAQMNVYFGWIQGSKMASVYVHLSGRDVDNAILQLHGLKPKEIERDKHLQPKKCLRCKSDNPATNRFCMLCGTPLDEETVMESIKLDQEKKKADNILDKLIDDPEVRKNIREENKKIE